MSKKYIITEKQVKLLSNNLKTKIKITEGQYDMLVDYKNKEDYQIFKEEVIKFIKEVCNKKRPKSKFFEDMGYGPQRMYKKLKEYGIVEYCLVEGKSEYKVPKKDIELKIYELSKCIEGKESIMDHEIPAHLVNDPEAPFNDPRDDRDYKSAKKDRLKYIKDLSQPYDDYSLFKSKNGDSYIASINDVELEDVEGFIDTDNEELTIDVFTKILNYEVENGSIEIDKSSPYLFDESGELKIYKVTPELKQQMDNEVNGTYDLEESTGAASSGSFVAPMGDGPIKKGITSLIDEGSLKPGLIFKRGGERFKIEDIKGKKLVGKIWDNRKNSSKEITMYKDSMSDWEQITEDKNK